MKILIFNCGSSTLKFQVVEAAPPDVTGMKLAQGIADRIGYSGSCHFTAANGASLTRNYEVGDHGAVTHLVFDRLGSAGVLTDGALNAVGHRVVHGGRHFTQPVQIDDKVIADLGAVTDLAPLHNRPSFLAIRTARDILSSGTPMVAVFDTAFHSQMPERAARYPIAEELAGRHNVRRYGFHGIAHRYMSQRYAALVGKRLADVKLITLQLGNGCSACAVAGGRSVDTSMDLTPLEGLMIGTRSGDIDPLACRVHLTTGGCQCGRG
ncbi:MAG: hypothetical protein ABID84_04245 [Chloroflexota bacterium]